MTAGPRTAIGLFGKIPTHGDYVRLNAAEPAALAFFDWVQAALDQLLRAGEKLPGCAVHFAVPFPEQRATLVGTLGPSRDSVGRVFPLAVFDTVELSSASAGLAGMLFGGARLRTDVASLLADSAILPPQGLLERARAVRPMGPAEIEQGRAELQTGLASTPAISVHDPAFAGLTEAEAVAVLSGLFGCCKPHRRREPTRPGPMLDCPVTHEASLFFWIETATRLLEWRGTHVSVLWTAGAGGGSPRMVLSLGTSPAALLALLGPGKAGSRLVTLRSTATGAPASVSVLPVLAAPETSLADLVDSLVREANG